MGKSVWRPKLLSFYDEHPETSSDEAAKAIGCNEGTAASAKNRWKELRGYVIGTVHHPVKGLVRKVLVEKETPVEAPKEIPEIPGEVIQVRAIADELLKKVLEAIKSYNSVLGERNFWREQANTNEAKAKKAEEEKTRVTKAYNELVKGVNRGQLPTLDEIVYTLRRDLKPGEKV